MHSAANSAHHHRRYGLITSLPRIALLLFSLWLFTDAGAAAAADLTISVKDQDETPYAGVTVYAYTQAGSYTDHSAVTDAAGTAAFGDVDQFTAGSYKFRAEHLGHNFYVENIDLPATTTANIIIAQAPVTLTVLTAGTAAQGINVYLFSDTRTYLSVNTATGDQGQAVFALPIDKVFDFRVDIFGKQYWKDDYTVLSDTNTITLNLLPSANITPDDLNINTQGQYVITTSTGQNYVLEGSYNGMDGPVEVTALGSDGNAVSTGTGSDGNFTINLPAGAGDLQIIIADPATGAFTAINTQWLIDDQPPELVVDGADTRSASESMITITGSAADGQSSIGEVVITSDQYSGLSFGATIGALGTFSGQVPLKIGDNLLTITVMDLHGNSAVHTITVTHTLAALPSIRIDSPVAGAIVTDPRITVSGIVRSSLSPGDIRLTLGNRVDFPTGTEGDYIFTFNNVDLAPGANTITVLAETVYGNASAQTTVLYATGDDTDEASPPQIQVFAPLPDTYLTEDPVVAGQVTSDLGVTAITVNGQNVVSAVGLGTAMASFQAPLSFATDTLPITIHAVDSEGNGNTLTYTVYTDTAAPVISLDDTGLQPPPAVNATIQSPYIVSGTITEAHPAGAEINGRVITLSPGATADTYTFRIGVTLTQGQEQQLDLTTWDQAGNRTSTEWIMRLDSNITIEVLSPANNAQLQGQGAATDISVTVRVTGAQADDQIQVAANGGTARTMGRSGDIGTATISVPTDQADHTLEVSVVDSGDTVLAATTSAFTIKNMDQVPLELVRQEPANNASDLEPNTFIAVYFNKALADPGLLVINVRETAHGSVYASGESGADLVEIGKIELSEVHRDNETVPGGLSLFPQDTMAAFYPQRDFAYGGTVLVDISYDGQTIGRSTFTIRPLPTFVQGFVTDQFNNPLEGIQITIPSQAGTAVTDKDGAYGFGYGESADRMLPTGRYRAVVNPGGKNSAFGTTELFLDVTNGRLNSAGLVRLSFLNPKEPYRLAQSNQTTPLLLNNGDLVLDLTDARLTFPNGKDQGALLSQFMKIQQVAYTPIPAAYPHWVYAINPTVEVDGSLAVTFAMPKLYDSHDYVNYIGERVIITALDPDALVIVPVGVGRVNTDQKTVTSEKPIQIERLDILGYALTAQENQTLLEQYANDEISLRELIGQLQAQQ